MPAPRLPLADRLELEALERLARGRGPRRGYGQALAARLARHTGADSYCLLLMDPARGLPVEVVSEFGAPARRDWLDAVLLRTPLGDLGLLARHPQRVQWASLFVERPADDPLVCRVLRPNGLGPMLCLALAERGRGWGYLHLLRREGAPEFGEGERRFLDACAPPIVAELRRRAASLLLNARPGAEMGLLTLDPAGEIDASNEACTALLSRPNAFALGMAVAVMTQLVRRGILEHGNAPLHALPVVDEDSGRRYTVRGQLLHAGGGRRRGAVIIEPLAALADPELMLRLGLTPRECDVAAMTVRGLSTGDAGAALGLSAHTVEHHLSNVFAKLAVGSRAEMGALLLASWGGTPGPQPAI